MELWHYVTLTLYGLVTAGLFFALWRKERATYRDYRVSYGTMMVLFLIALFWFPVLIYYGLERVYTRFRPTR